MSCSRIIVHSILLLLSISHLRAQSPAQEITEKEIDYKRSFRDLDTSIERVEIFNPAFQQIVFQDLGNIGSAFQPLLFSNQINTGFRYAPNPFGIYFKNPQQTQYYRTFKPLTDISYAQGKNELLFLKIKHAQNIHARWNAGIDFQRITTHGFQEKAITGMYNYQFFTSYFSKNLRYQILANGTWNRGVNDENGGISSDSVYEILTGASKFVDVRLDNAQNRYRNRSIYAKQYYRFGKPQYQYTDKDTLYDFKTRVQLSHTFHAEELSYVFSNTGNRDTLLQPNQYYDTGVNTFDSTYDGRLNNRLQLQVFKLIPAPFKILGDTTLLQVVEVGLKSEFINIAQIPFVRNFRNEIIEGRMEWLSVNDGSSVARLKGAFVSSGYNAGDFDAEIFGQIRLDKLTFGAGFTTQLFRPDYAMQRYRSNAFIWDNNFVQTNINTIQLNIATRTFRNNFKLKYSHFQLQDWVYLGSDILPAQSNELIQIQQLALGKTFQVWRFYFEHQFYVQNSSSNLIRLPELSGMIRYTYRAKFFGITKFQLGVDVFYNTAFYANGYNPALRLFHLQDRVSIGNYPIADPFLICEVKKAHFFLKYEHANMNIINSGMYHTPGYPVSQASFRFGLRWRFYD